MKEGLICTDCPTPFPAGVKKPRRKVLRCPSCAAIARRRYFANWKIQNPEKYREHIVRWRVQNREKIFAQVRVWRATHPERVLATARARYARHPEKECALRRVRWAHRPEEVRARARARITRRRATDPEFRLRECLRHRIYLALRGENKSDRTVQLLGCPIPDLRAHLEAQFRPGMTWENYGPVWHVDHKRPCASFNLVDPAQQRECFNFQNLQPLFALENIRKGAKV